MPNHHHIQRSSIHLKLPSSVDHFQLSQTISRLFWEGVVPELEKLLDKSVGEEELIRIDQLEVTMQFDSWREAAEGFVPVLLQSLEEQLDLMLTGQQAAVDRQAVPEAQFRSWLQFLKKGYMEYMSSEVYSQLEKNLILQIRQDANAQTELKSLLTQYPLARKRLVRQYDFDFVKSLLGIYFQSKLKRFSADVRELPEFLRLISQVDPERTKEMFKPSFLKYPTAELSSYLIDAVITGGTRHAEDELILYVVLNALKEKKDAKVLFFLTKKIIRTRLSNLSKNRAFIQRMASLLATITSGESEEGPELKPDSPESEKDIRSEEMPGNKSPDNKQDDTSTAPEDDAGSLKEARGTSKKPKDTTSTPDEESTAESSLTKDLTAAKEVPGSQEKDRSGEEPSVDSQAIIDAAASDSKTSGNTESHLGDSKQTPDKSTPDSLPSETPPPKLDQETHYINHAGLLLLHPFLPQLFRTVGLVDHQTFVDEAAQEKAVHLLHYLAAKTYNLPEYQLLFPKLLCGLPFEVPISKDVKLTANEIEEAEGLLTAVIENWGALGTTGPDAFREGFLQRSGKLIWKKTHWQVIVEKKTIDILLTKLPWGYGMIKLPWMKERLTVEWG